MTTDRDQSIERLLRRPLSSDRQAPDHCPDAETLAAMADDTLTAAARRDVEAHVADCHRCQALTAAMVRAESSAGTTAGDAAAAVPWWTVRPLKWLVPAAAAATAVALWVAVPGQRAPFSEEPTPESQIAAAPSATAPEASRLDAPPPPADALAESAALGRETQVGQQNAAPAAAQPAAPAESSLKTEESLGREARTEVTVTGAPPPSLGAAASAPAPADRSVDQNQAAGRGSAAEGLSPSREASAAAPASADRSAARGQASGQAARNESARTESAPAPQERALNQPAPPPAAARAAAEASGFRVAAGFDVVSPNPRMRWRVGPGPVVQYSANEGVTWVMQQTGVSAELTAGSSPAPDVCWLVGRGGLVLRTTDGGRQWQRTPFPETVDLTAVTASTALDASVTLADGRRLASTDGGRTWAPVRQ